MPLAAGDHRESTLVLEDLLPDEEPTDPLDAGMWMSYLAAGYTTAEPEKAAARAQDSLAQRCSRSCTTLGSHSR